MNENFTPNQNNYKNLTPFKSWLLLQINTWGQTNFPYVESDFDELTNYGMMQKLMGAINDVISNENKVEQDMTNLFNAFTELQTYLFSEFADLKNYVDNYFENTLPTLVNNKLDEMLEDGTIDEIFSKYNSNYITTSQLKLIANNTDEAINNMTKLSTAINNGKNIIVDDIYYLDTNNTINITNNNLIITGRKNANVGFKFNTNQKTLFNANSCLNISVNNIILENLNQYGITFLQLSATSNWYLNNISIENNDVKGKICFLTANYADINPTLGVNGINKLRIFNNKFTNISQISCFNLFNIPSNYVELSNNYIHNFTNKFFGLIVENEYTYGENIRNNIDYVLIHDNYVICDNNYNVETSDDGSYYCFVIIEGNKCDYYNNHVEGMKQLTQTNTLYDCYLSVNELNSHDNIYKNNMSFTTGLTYLLKSKGGNIGFKRYYNNNVYIIEREWQLLYDNNLSHAVYFIDVLSNAIPLEYVISNCKFDIPYLKGSGNQIAQCLDLGNFSFINNIFKIGKGDKDRYLVSYKTTQTNRVINIENNYIDSADYSLGLITTNYDNNTQLIKDIIIRNNYFKGYYLINTINGTNYIIENNNLHFYDSTNVSMIYSGKVTKNNDFKFTNNSIYIDNDGTANLLRIPFNNNNLYIDNMCFGRFPDGANQGLQLSGDMSSNFESLYYCEYSIYHATGKQKFNTSFKYGHDSSGTYIELVDENNTSRKIYSSESVTTFNVKINNETDITRSSLVCRVSSSYFTISLYANYAVSNKSFLMNQCIKSVKIS